MEQLGAMADGSAGVSSHEEMRSAVAERYAPLFDPVTIGPKTAPNRFYGVPYSTGWDMSEIALERAHRRTRAEGGWGVVCTGQVLFERESVVDFIDMLELFDDDDAHALASVAEGIHEFGALAGLELGHPGAIASPGTWRVPPRGPSQVLTDAMFFSPAIAQEMTRQDIRELQDAWVAAARRGRQAGFDIVYVQCAHSALAMQFLTPYYNHRTDAYGGSLENRARLLLELLERVRDEVGHDTAVACRFAIEGLGPFSLQIDEALEVMQMADHLVDLWDLSIGGFSNAGHDLTPSRLHEEGASLQWTRRAHEVTRKPVVGSGRFTDPDLMLKVVAAGELDFVGGARPGIADPFLPRKIASGEIGGIRECIGSNRCAYSQAMGNMSCSQNAAAGEEHRRGWHPERFTPAANADRPVLVVGAGPAGLECATVLARRGFGQIHIVDAESEMGGHMRWFSRLPGFAAWGRVVDHRRSLIAQSSAVQFAASTRLDAQAVLDYGAAIVVIATGSRWAMHADSFFTNTPVPGADASLDHVLTPEQLILDGKPVPGKRVVIYDCQADHVALGVAQYLQAGGHEVEIASPLADIGMRVLQDGTAHALRAEIQAGGGQLRPGVFLAAVDATGPVFLDGAMTQVQAPADAVVLLTRRASEDALYRELLDLPAEREQAGFEALYRIGDCLAPQDLADAIFSGHRLAREIDTHNPAVALPATRS